MSDETNAPAPGQLSGTQTRKTLLQRPVNMGDTKTRTGIKLRLAKPGAPQVPLSGAAPRPAVPITPRPAVPGTGASQVPPAAKPASPVIKPVIPAAKPAAPAAKPVIPVAKPATPVVKPTVTPVAKPTPATDDTSTKSTPTIGAGANVLKDTKTRRAILMSKAAPTVRPNTVPIDAKSTATASVPKPLAAPVHSDDRTVRLTRPVRPKPPVAAAPKTADPIAPKPVEPEKPKAVEPVVAPAPAAEPPKVVEPAPAPTEKTEPAAAPETKTEAPKFKLKLKLGQKTNPAPAPAPAPTPAPVAAPTPAPAPKIVPQGAPKAEEEKKPASPVVQAECSKFQLIAVSVATFVLLVATFLNTASFLHVQMDKDITKDMPFLSSLK